jgi:Lrp/AsnC family transcriptional regulator, leucine-responsive regulatory protein
MPEISLDRTDLKLLDLLQKDGRLTNVQLGEKVSLSPSPCLRRVRTLEDKGVIKQYVALLDPLKVGLGLLAYVNVTLEKRGKMAGELFGRTVQAWPEVVSCYSMTGEMDYLLRVHVQDLEHFTRFMMDRLLKQPSVIDVKSTFVLEKIKDTTALPLGRAG